MQHYQPKFKVGDKLQLVDIDAVPYGWIYCMVTAVSQRTYTMALCKNDKFELITLDQPPRTMTAKFNVEQTDSQYVLYYSPEGAFYRL